MSWKSLNNKYLIVRNGVVLTEHIDPVIHALDEYFNGHLSYITSGLRDAESQLRIIRDALTRKGIAGDYQEAWDNITSKITFEGEDVYSWQPGWSKLLNIGFIVNPPYPAVALMDYFRPGSQENKKGKMIGDSPHTRGTAFDIGGGKDGVVNEAIVMEHAMKAKVSGLKGYLIERNNNAVHVDCMPIDITNFK